MLQSCLWKRRFMELFDVQFSLIFNDIWSPELSNFDESLTQHAHGSHRKGVTAGSQRETKTHMFFFPQICCLQHWGSYQVSRVGSWMVLPDSPFAALQPLEGPWMLVRALGMPRGVSKPLGCVSEASWKPSVSRLRRLVASCGSNTLHNAARASAPC